jgi:hypothetical protein
MAISSLASYGISKGIQNVFANKVVYYLNAASTSGVVGYAEKEASLLLKSVGDSIGTALTGGTAVDTAAAGLSAQFSSAFWSGGFNAVVMIFTVTEPVNEGEVEALAHDKYSNYDPSRDKIEIDNEGNITISGQTESNDSDDGE